MNRETVIVQLKELLRDEFPSIRGIDLENNTPLLSAGLLDSFAVVTLVAAIEAAFKVNVDVENLEYSSFECVNAMADFCEQLINKKA